MPSASVFKYFRPLARWATMTLVALPPPIVQNARRYRSQSPLSRGRCRASKRHLFLERLLLRRSRRSAGPCLPHHRHERMIDAEVDRKVRDQTPRKSKRPRVAPGPLATLVPNWQKPMMLRVRMKALSPCLWRWPARLPLARLWRQFRRGLQACSPWLGMAGLKGEPFWALSGPNDCSHTGITGGLFYAVRQTEHAQIITSIGASDG